MSLLILFCFVSIFFVLIGSMVGMLWGVGGGGVLRLRGGGPVAVSEAECAEGGGVLRKGCGLGGERTAQQHAARVWPAAAGISR